MSHFDTDNYPVVRAANYTAANRSQPEDVQCVVLHTVEAAEKDETAENIAKYFARSTTRASAHYIVDNNSIIQGVWDKDVAWAAPGMNRKGIQIEQAGYAGQTAAQWRDPYSLATVDNAAKIAAQICLKFHIPVRRITNAQMKAGEKGIVDHNQVSQTYKKSTHWDCGPHYPWDYFLKRCQDWYDHYNPDKPVEPPAPPPNDFEVVVSADSDVDFILAHMLGMQHNFKVLHKRDLVNYRIGYVVAIGGGADIIIAQVGDGVAVTGANRWETAKKVLALINDKDVPRRRPWSD